jgi:hypothetical protein
VTRTRVLRSSILTLVGAALFAQAAVAGGEPKNEWPFTRPVMQRSPQAAAHATSRVEPAIQGEPKNEPPFTRPATIVVSSGSGFNWTDGGLGAAAGVGIALAAGGLLTLTRKSPQPA